MNEIEKARRVEKAMTAIRAGASHGASEIGADWNDIPAVMAETSVDNFLYRLLGPAADDKPVAEVLGLTVGDLARCRDLIDDDGDWT